MFCRVQLAVTCGTSDYRQPSCQDPIHRVWTLGCNHKACKAGIPKATVLSYLFIFGGSWLPSSRRGLEATLRDIRMDDSKCGSDDSVLCRPCGAVVTWATPSVAQGGHILSGSNLDLPFLLQTCFSDSPFFTLKKKKISFCTIQKSSLHFYVITALFRIARIWK